MSGRIQSLLEEFFYSFNPILLVLVFVLFSAYINNVIIKYRLAEFDNGLTSLSNRENTGHSVNMLSRFRLIKEQLKNPDQIDDDPTKEIKFRAISQKSLLRETPIRFTRSDKIAIKVISGVRFLLGKEQSHLNEKKKEIPGLEEAYFYERNRQYDKAKKNYSRILMKEKMPSNLRSTILMHNSFCMALLGEYQSAKNMLSEVKNGRVYQGTVNWQIAHKLYDEIDDLEDKFRILQSNPNRNKAAQGRQMYLLGNYKNAINILSRELKAKRIPMEELSESHYILGRANEDLGKEDEAIDNYRKIIRANPRSEWAKKANRRLYILGKFYTNSEALTKVATVNSKYFGDMELIKKLGEYKRLEKEVNEIIPEKIPLPPKKAIKSIDRLKAVSKKTSTTDVMADTVAARGPSPVKESSLVVDTGLSTGPKIAPAVVKDIIPDKHGVERAQKIDKKTKRIFNMLDELRIAQDEQEYEPVVERVIARAEKVKTVKKEPKEEIIFTNPVRTKDVFSVIRARSGELKYTFKKWKRKGKVKGGKLTLRLKISAMGQVVSAEIYKQDKGVMHTEFGEELLNKVRKWKFRPVDASEPDLAISFPVTFLSKDTRNVRK